MAVKPYTPVQLYCFPYAGASAGAVYARWRRLLPDWLELHPVELPGRGRRMTETLLESMPELVNQLRQELAPRLRAPYIFFGHSMGALLAFELARALSQSGMPQPELLFASGTDAPSRRDETRFAKLQTDRELMDQLRELNGTPPEVLENAEILALMLPVLRADFRICGSYRHRPGRLLTCPIHVFGGSEDATTAETLSAWGLETSGQFGLDMLEGDHFFINTEQARLLELVVKRAGERLAAPAVASGEFACG